MKCPIETQETADLLLAYCTRRLDPAIGAMLERHMARCAACQRFSKAQRAVWEALDQWEAAPVSPDFDRRLYARIEQEKQKGWWRRLRGPNAPVWPRWTIPASIAACLIFMAGVLLNPPRFRAPVESRVEAVQAEQVERTLEDMELLGQLKLTQASDSI